MKHLETIMYGSAVFIVLCVVGALLINANTIKLLRNEVYTLEKVIIAQQAYNPMSTQERYKDYTITDLVVLNRILAEFIEPTAGHYIRLDINRDGVLDVLDSAKLHRILAGLE